MICVPQKERKLLPMFTQKILLILISCLWLSDIIGQTRQHIIRSIRDVKVQTLNNAAYDVNEEDLRSNLKSYFKACGYQLEAEDDSTIQFSTQVTYVAERRRYIPLHHLYSWTGIGYRTYCTKAFVDIKIIDLGIALQLDIYPNIDTRRSTYKNPRPSNAVFKFQEYRLREHLYISYYGDEIQIPDDIMASICQYNDTQTKNRRKILVGRDY